MNFKTCRNMGNKNNSKTLTKTQKLVGDDIELGDVELEDILDCQFKEDEDQFYYLVKWKGFRLEFANWIPEYELEEDAELCGHYKAIYVEHSVPEKTFRYFAEDVLTRQDPLSLRKLASLFFPINEKQLLELGLSFQELAEKVRAVMRKELGALIGKQLQRVLDVILFVQSRKQVLISLQELEDTMNASLSTKMVFAQNDVDLELAPKNFKFITEYTSNSVVINREPVIYCTCVRCGEDCRECCPSVDDALFPFGLEGCLILRDGYPILECNSKCQCGPDCPNRVTQHGRTFQTAVFRTQDGRGWGLRAMQEIRVYRFVTEYLGEVVTSEEAEYRNTAYQADGKFYLFDLNCEEQRKCTYTVDATLRGNESRFINHSCEPNLSVFKVWVDCPDPKLPRLAFFSRRTIKAGEELTIDYGWDASAAQIPCKCGSKKCRKFIL